MKDKIVVVYFTTENNFELADVSVSYFKKHSKNLKINIVSNRLPDGYVKKHDDVEYFDMGINFDSSSKHFGETMTSYLNNINYDYILFLCDDYVLIDDVKERDLEELIQYMICGNIDYFGFDDMNPDATKMPEQTHKTSCKNRHSEQFIIRNSDHEYLYSVQPCIWKRETLLKILEKDISIHDLDNTIESLRNYNDIIALGTSLMSHMTYKNYIDIKNIDYFILSYVEIVRHGVFILPENDPHRDEEEVQVKVIRDIIRDRSITDNTLLLRLLHYTKKNY